MTPAVFLVILCLGVASAAESPDPTLDAEGQELKIKNEKQDEEGFQRRMWEEFIRKIELYNKENGQEDKEDANLEVNVFDHLTDDEFVGVIDKVLYPMLGEEEKTQTEPVGDVSKFEDLAGSSAVTPVQDQVFVTSLVLSYCLRMASAASSRDPSLDAEWEEWKMKFEKTYSPDEERYRRAVWEEEKKNIEKHNAEYQQGKTTFNMGLNEFSDMTYEEFRKICCGNLMWTEEELDCDIHEYKDLTKDNNATPEKDQVLVTSLMLSYCLRVASAAPSRDPSLDAEWEEWKMKFKKTYSPDEEGHRRAVWEKNRKIIENHNADYDQGKTSYSVGLNRFSDMTHEELKKSCLRMLKSTKDLRKPKTLEENNNVAPVMDEMGKKQCKNTFNSIKSNMAPPELTDDTMARPEHSNEDEEENNPKNDYEDDKGP
ncbi:hypothetical protein STEG23_029953 [Scotinomys teguina]